MRDTMERTAELDTLATEVEQLLDKHDHPLEDESVRRQVEKLKRWLEVRRREHTPMGISRAGSMWLAELRDRLKMAAEERQRLEGEGGTPASKEQAERTEEMLKTACHIDKLLSEVE
jgi:hypothetical protein